jgi:hypothetical protein
MVAPTTPSIPEANHNLLFGAPLGYLDAARFAEACSACATGPSTPGRPGRRPWMAHGGTARRSNAACSRRPCQPRATADASPGADGDPDLPID